MIATPSVAADTAANPLSYITPYSKCPTVCADPEALAVPADGALCKSRPNDNLQIARRNLDPSNRNPYQGPARADIIPPNPVVRPHFHLSPLA